LFLLLFVFVVVGFWGCGNNNNP